jgi:hypothetical protein
VRARHVPHPRTIFFNRKHSVITTACFSGLSYAALLLSETHNRTLHRQR